MASHGFSGLGSEYIEVSDLGGKTVADAIRLVEQTLAPPPTTVENLYYFHNEHLGTPQAMTDSSQNLVWGADYEPFGQVNPYTNSIVNNLRFPGQYYDEETDQHYNYFRDYDPVTGRYIQSDPIGILMFLDDPKMLLSVQAGLIADPVTQVGYLNQNYSYTDGDPINTIDPVSIPRQSRGILTRYWYWSNPSGQGATVVRKSIVGYNFCSIYFIVSVRLRKEMRPVRG